MRIHHSLHAAAMALAVALTAAAPASATAAETRNAASTVVDTSRIRIGNFGQVDPTYFRGAQPQGRDYADLAALGIKTVINLAGSDAEPRERAMVEKAGMTYLQIPMNVHVPPTPAQLAQFLGVVNGRASQPVFVHCIGGKHRTGVMTAVYRMTRTAWTAQQAFNEMKAFHFGADFLHREFKAFVFAYRPPQPALAAAAAAVAPTVGQ